VIRFFEANWIPVLCLLAFAVVLLYTEFRPHKN
jgi:hypothetical protein